MEMDKTKVMCYAYGIIVEGNDGVCYDRRQVAMIGVS